MAASHGTTQTSEGKWQVATGSASSQTAMPDSLPGLTTAIIEIGIFSLFINVLMLILPIYMLQIYDRVLPSSSRETLIYLSAIAIAGLILLACLDVVRSIYATRRATRFDQSKAGTAFRSALASVQSPSGDIQSLRDLSVVRRFFCSRSAFALFDLPFVPLFVALLWFVHPALFLLTASGAAWIACLALANQLATAKRAQLCSDTDFSSLAIAQSYVRNAEAVRSMGMINNAIKAFGQSHAVSLAQANHVAQVNAIFAGLSRLSRMSLQIAILGLGAHLTLGGEMTAGMIFAASIISARALQPVDQLIGGWRHHVDAFTAWKRFQRATALIPASQGLVELPHPKGSVRLENVHYAVDPTKGAASSVLKRITFNVPKGESVAIIGSSGAGKSTLARLIVGAIAPTLGCVRLDESNLAHWPSDVLGRQIGYLPQDLELLPGTIAQNIARFCPNAEDAAIVDAAQRAQVHDLIQSLPDGYNTQIGPASRLLSGGHRQRIGLARAFFGNPCLLVLDEPNAHLDEAGDDALIRALKEARSSGATVLIVTQRKSIIGEVDRLLVLKDGCVDDYGPPEMVLGRQTQKSMTGGSAVRPLQISRGHSSSRPSVRKHKQAVKTGSGQSQAARTGAVSAPSTSP